ncbi:probable S-adenosylmethionine-dependent methyltransferase at5g37990 [Phtheirospermum japonicum]|uniref:Probable S-adenosylmethionine-dependent methyltransferase at5g37990 n=1 Tax=Phtheirospermum japonicum TaxID=374723 RepID=A0A830D407_9LAMI|nr:probable S-adenosylmethionine-dependent methyltransferase at5g37990 [Phtheirospermum japonicum]
MGGDGPNSYAHNSNYQRQLLLTAEDLIHELINDHLDTSNPPFNDPHKTLRIADLGCSVGPNAFFAVQNIITAVENKYKSDDHRTPEFHVFFNDLVDNDFNTLFRNLSGSTRNNYFFAGSPGSFHARLFPKGTLHFAHCSTALHWLSRIPERVLETSSDAWNKGRIHYSGAGKEVKDAYWGQYKKDMGDFLSARADEVVAGGLMALVILGFPDGELLSQSSIGVAFQILGSCLQDMAQTVSLILYFNILIKLVYNF